MVLIGIVGKGSLTAYSHPYNDNINFILPNPYSCFALAFLYFS